MEKLKEYIIAQTCSTTRDYKIFVEQKQILQEYGKLATRS